MKLWTIEYKHSGLKGTYKSSLRAKTKEEAIAKFEQKKYNEKNKIISVYEKEEKKTVKKLSKEVQMIDTLISSVGGKTTAKRLLTAGYKKSKEQFITASEVVGKRFCINPVGIRKWYKEKYL